MRNVDGEEGQIEDPQERAQVRRQALMVHIESIATGIALTAIAVFIP